MRPSAAAEIRSIVPVRKVVATCPPRSGPVRDLIVDKAGGLETVDGRPVLLQLRVGVGHADQPGPNLLAETCSLLDGELVSGQMVDALVDDGFEGFHPTRKVHAGNAVEEVAVDVAEPGGARRADRLDGLHPRMQALEKTQRSRLKALHANAQPVDPELQPALDALGRDVARVRLQGDLGVLTQANRPNAIKEKPQLLSR